MNQLSFAAVTEAPPPKRISRDEMNLAEFPLTVLSTRPGAGVKTLEFSDSIRGRNGELVNRNWIITGADKFGLPTSSDDEVLLGLLKLTVDDQFRARKVFFTRYELLRILRWTTEGRSYVRLQKALDRLSGVRIKATNAFYDNESKSHSTRNFGLVDAYEINDGRSSAPKPSFFIWSEVLFKSFQVGFIKKFDLDFYLALKSAVSRRLYRYLDKHFWYKSRVHINLFTLAHEKVGISRNYVYTSSIRQQLDPAVEELVAQGFLSHCEYSGKGRDTEIAMFAGSRINPAAARGRTLPRSEGPSAESTQPREAAVVRELRPPRAEAVAAEGPAAQGECSDRELVEMLSARGIKEPLARRLLAGKGPAACERIQRIVRYFDELLAARSPRISRNPVGFLYRAVEKYETFTLPGEKPAPLQMQAEPAIDSPRASRPPEQPAEPSRTTLESEYLVARKREILALQADIEPELLQKVSREVEEALGKLKGLISPLRFDEAIQHGVEEKLASLFAFPSFEEWLKTRRKK